MKFSKTVINQLDEKLESIKLIYTQAFNRIPAKGWISVIRNALGMTSYALAKKMGLTQARVIQIEKAEQTQSITLKTLEKAAEAMGCRVIYAFVPETSLKKIIEDQARKVAKEHLKRVSHSMDLEAQSVDPKKSQEQLEELVKDLVDGSLKKLWKDE